MIIGAVVFVIVLLAGLGVGAAPYLQGNDGPPKPALPGANETKALEEQINRV